MSKQVRRKDSKVYSVLLIAISVVTLIVFLLILGNLNTLDPNSDQIQSLYALLGDEQLDYCNGLALYNTGEMTYQTVDYSQKLCMAYKLVEKDDKQTLQLNKTKKKEFCEFLDKKFKLDDNDTTCSVDTISYDALNSAFYKLFGKKIALEMDFELNGFKACYYEKEESRYVCGDLTENKIQLGWTPTTYRIITKAKEKGNKIFIYDKYLAINNSSCYTDNTGFNKNDKCSKLINDNREYDIKFVSKHGQKYLHVFQQDKDGIYHWVSTTPI